MTVDKGANKKNKKYDVASSFLAILDYLRAWFVYLNYVNIQW